MFHHIRINAANYNCKILSTVKSHPGFRVLEFEKICLRNDEREYVLFFAFGNKDLPKGSRQGHLAFSLRFWLLFKVRFMQGSRVVRQHPN